MLFVAHELKAPLAVLRQLALALDERDGGNERIRAEMISVSERAIKQVNDLARIKRLNDGLFEMEPVAVRAVCDDVASELGRLYSFNEREFLLRYRNRSRLVHANRELLYSVLYNFMLNAMHYSKKKTKTELIVNDNKGRVKISVRDYGPELPIGIWRKIKSGKIDGPTPIAMRPGSSGLGLYIASTFSHYMNATMGAIRHRDGTSFYIEMPVSKQASLF